VSDYLVSVLLGIVEGLTEFLPVSSTAHLRIAEVLLHVDLASGYWKMYTIVIQLGAILTLPIYFRHRIAKLLSTFPAGERGDRTVLTHPLSLVLIAFVVTAIPAFLMTKIIGKHLESLYIMGCALLIGGILMWFIDARNAKSEAAGENASPPRLIHTWHMEAMSLGQAVWIGACQILSAVFPGTSRSMSTIAAGQLAGMSRASALEFSFFLSIPTMVVATCYDLLKSLVGKNANPIGVSTIDAHGWIVLGIGFLVSFLVAYGSVAWFMAWVRRRGFGPFAIYRIILGIAVLFFASRLST
jgi:undecaprenyl-diphosphatase